jgi:hypothetical protein
MRVSQVRHASPLSPAKNRLLLALAGAAAVLLSSCQEPMGPAHEDVNELAVAAATTTTLEAENAVRAGAVVSTQHAGYTGTGFVDYLHASGDYVDWTLSNLTAGTYTITIRYGNGGATDRPLKVTDGATTLKTSLSFPPTGAWTTWKTVSFSQGFTAGTHHVRLTAIGSSGANVDNLQFSLVPPPVTSKKAVVGYLPNWDGDYATWAGKLNYAGLTHINLAFGNPDGNGVTQLGQSSSSLATLVNAAHSKGVKVLVSIGGASGLGNVGTWLGTKRSTYVANLAGFVSSNNLDGVDVDLEGNDVDGNYAPFISDLINAIRPKGKLVTAALSPWFSDRIPAASLQSFDLVNVMAYDECGEWSGACEQSTYTLAVNMLNSYTGRGVAASKLVLGFPAYGWCWGSGCAASEYSYAKILATWPDAYTKDWIQTSNIQLSYNGNATVQKKATLARSYGGVMAWEIPSDATGGSSLLGKAAATLWAP